MTYYHFKGIHKTIRPDNSHDVWSYSLVESDKEYDLDVDTDEASGNTLTIFINYKVFDGQGGLLGVAGVGLKVDMMAQLVRAYKERYDRSVYLTDQPFFEGIPGAGTILLRPVAFGVDFYGDTLFTTRDRLDSDRDSAPANTFASA